MTTTGYVNGQFVIGTIAAPSGSPLVLQDSGATVSLTIESGEILLTDAAQDYYVAVTPTLAIMNGPGGSVTCNATEVLIHDGTDSYNIQVKSTSVGMGNTPGTSYIIINSTVTQVVNSEVELVSVNNTSYVQVNPTLTVVLSPNIDIIANGTVFINGNNVSSPGSSPYITVTSSLATISGGTSGASLTTSATQAVLTGPQIVLQGAATNLIVDPTIITATSAGGQLTLNATQVILANAAVTAELLISATPEIDLIVGSTAISVGTALVQVTTPSSGSGVSTNVISFVTTGAVDTQLGTAKRYLQYATTIGGGGSVSLTIPLTLNLSCVLLEITTMMKIVTGGTATAAGDSWIQRGYYAAENQGGSLVQTAVYTAVYTAVGNAHLVTSAVTASVSGTTITILFTPLTGAFGSLGTADVEIFADAWLN